MEGGQAVSLSKRDLKDFAWIRRNIPIQDVYRKLGLKVIGKRGHCWQPSAHNNGDATPSVSFFRNKKGEWRAHCHGCGERSMSAIDLVIKVKGLQTGRDGQRQAAEWIAENFTGVPSMAQATQDDSAKRANPFGAVDVIKNLLLTGMLDMKLELKNGDPGTRPVKLEPLGLAAQKALFLLLCLIDSGEHRISYSQLARRAGVGRDSVAEAVNWAEIAGLMEVERDGSPADILMDMGERPDKNCYFLKAGSQTFQEFIVLAKQAGRTGQADLPYRRRRGRPTIPPTLGDREQNQPLYPNNDLGTTELGYRTDSEFIGLVTGPVSPTQAQVQPQKGELEEPFLPREWRRTEKEERHDTLLDEFEPPEPRELRRIVRYRPLLHDEPY